MKKLVLFVMAVMAFAGMSVAQDVYYSGYYIDGNSVQQAAVYKNNEKLYNSSFNTNGYYGESDDVDVYNGDVYWVKNVFDPSNNYYYADVMKNNDTYLNSPTGQGRHIFDLYRWPERPELGLFSVGCMNIEAVRTAVIWKDDNSSVYRQLGDGTWPSVAYSVTATEDGLYACGFQYGYEETSYHGVIWSGGSVFATFPDGSKLYSIDYYEGYLWTEGLEGNTAKVWKIDITDGSIEEVYVLDSNGYDFPQYHEICVDDAGDVYAVELSDLYKNGTSIHWTGSTFTSVVANSDGVFYSENAWIIKDGIPFCWPHTDCSRINGLFIDEPECTDSEIRSLPYFEGFETSATDWACWTVSDNDGNNGARPSYWHRGGENVEGGYVASTGGNFAWHAYGPTSVEQEGWLKSPLIHIPEIGGDVTLTFNSFEVYSNDYEYEAVWIGNSTAPNDEVWVASSDFVSAEWKEVELDLTEYKDMDITVWFRYKGTYAHSWLIDDVSIVQGEATYYTVTTEVNPVGAGTVEGGGAYPEQSNVYLTAYPNPGWAFDHWTGGYTDNPYLFTIVNDVTYTAYFVQEEYTLSVNALPAEGGIVTGGGTYHYGDMATLTATANTGYTFVSWSDGNSNAMRTVEVTGDAEYNAIFTQGDVTMYTVTVVSENPLLGSVTGGGTFPEGAVTQISATPSPSARFVSWDDGNTDNPRTITVTGDVTYTARFEALPNYTITVVSADPTMGSATGGGTFMEGTVINISATPLTGYYFIGWDDGNADNPRSITVTQDATYIAQFASTPVQTFSLTVICNSAEGSTVGSGTYTAGSTATIAAIPNSGFEFDKWNDGNTDNPRQVVVNSAMTFVAFFKGTGVGEDEGRMMVLYPNPATDHVRIEGIEANSEVRIYNAMGALVKVTNASANEEIGIGELSAGLYLLRCGNVTLRFVKM